MFECDFEFHLTLYIQLLLHWYNRANTHFSTCPLVPSYATMPLSIWIYKIYIQVSRRVRIDRRHNKFAALDVDTILAYIYLLTMATGSNHTHSEKLKVEPFSWLALTDRIRYLPASGGKFFQFFHVHFCMCGVVCGVAWMFGSGIIKLIICVIPCTLCHI